MYEQLPARTYYGGVHAALSRFTIRSYFNDCYYRRVRCTSPAPGRYNAVLAPSLGPTWLPAGAGHASSARVRQYCSYVRVRSY